MVVDGERITTPLSITNIAQVLTESINKSVGYLCSNLHGKINKWSRYKPVISDTTVKNDTFDSDTMMWGESLMSGTRKPWFFGTASNPVFKIPLITDSNSIGKDGVQNKDKVWVYQPPRGKDIGEDAANTGRYRFSDFAGYNHNANQPFNVILSPDLKLNLTFTASISSNATNNYAGEFEMEDVVKLFPNPDNLYLAIIIYNKTKGITRTYSNVEPITEYDGTRFSINPHSGANIASGGFGHSVALDDVVDIKLCLCSVPGTDDVFSAMNYSLMCDKSAMVYKRYIVDRVNVVVNIKYKVSNMSTNVSDIGTYYINDYDSGGDGNVYKTHQAITSISGRLTVRRTDNSEYSRFVILVAGLGIAVRSDGTKFLANAISTTSLYEASAGSFTQNDRIFSFDITGSLGTTVYRTQQDAEMLRNGFILYGIPIFQEVLYNYGDAEDLGNFISNILSVSCYAAKYGAWVHITMTSEDAGNIIPNTQP